MTCTGHCAGLAGCPGCGHLDRLDERCWGLTCARRSSPSRPPQPRDRDQTRRSIPSRPPSPPRQSETTVATPPVEPVETTAGTPDAPRRSSPSRPPQGAPDRTPRRSSPSRPRSQHRPDPAGRARRDHRAPPGPPVEPVETTAPALTCTPPVEPVETTAPTPNPPRRSSPSRPPQEPGPHPPVELVETTAGKPPGPQRDAARLRNRRRHRRHRRRTVDRSRAHRDGGAGMGGMVPPKSGQCALRAPVALLARGWARRPRCWSPPGWPPRWPRPCARWPRGRACRGRRRRSRCRPGRPTAAAGHDAAGAPQDERVDLELEQHLALVRPRWEIGRALVVHHPQRAVGSLVEAVDDAAQPQAGLELRLDVRLALRGLEAGRVLQGVPAVHGLVRRGEPGHLLSCSAAGRPPPGPARTARAARPRPARAARAPARGSGRRPGGRRPPPAPGGPGCRARRPARRSRGTVDRAVAEQQGAAHEVPGAARGERRGHLRRAAADHAWRTT